MFDVNNLNTTATAITQTIENVKQNINHNNLKLASALLSPSSSAITTNDINSTLLNDVGLNTTAAAVIDYTTQWLPTIIATVAANLTSSISDETAIFSPSSLIPASNNNSISNYTHTTTMPMGDTYNITNRYNFSSENLDIHYDITTITDDDNYYHECHPDNPNFNCSRMDYVVFILGPQTLPLYKALLITIMYGGIFFTGFIGNLFVCIVIFKHPTMHTATNYYLFSLAVSDLIYLIFGLPTEVILYWHQYPYLFGKLFCKARAYISEASTYVSVLTIVAFSMERYLAICHPLYLYAMSGFRRALSIIVLLWLISFTFAIPFYIYTDIKFWNYPPDNTRIDDSAMCTFETPDNFPLFEISSLLSFFVPMFSMFYFYGRMGIKICTRTTQKLGVQKGSLQRKTKHQQSRKAVIRMLAAVVVTFFICWLPFHIQRLWYVHGKEYQNYQEINEWLFSITGFAYYVTCTINPILYNVMSHRYRVAFKDILCCKRRSLQYNNGFTREQSRYYETTNVSSLGNCSYNRINSIRASSFRNQNNAKDRSSIKSNSVSWKNSDFHISNHKDIQHRHSTTLNDSNDLVVCVENVVNGHSKVLIQNEAHEMLLNKNNGTRI